MKLYICSTSFLTIHGLALNLGIAMSGGTHPSQRVHSMEPWPQELEKPDTSPTPEMAYGMASVIDYRGVGSEQ